ncbi:LysR substrate-binding domain-containing protein [Roseibium hamelinense]|uniref:LysR substrate-binding domain-containing protein n=1 Tax=Roseibium hamelinense TaxID=150831 RepID=UPI00147813F5|nr:LysR substrate-binding domain-containing protein [Roseibium hamelinense]
MSNLPPLNALRSFCAVGQKKSIAGAAAELSVSPSAVSQQIKTLEAWIGVQLLQRRNSSVELTEKGASYYASVWQALSLIEDATQNLRGAENSAQLTISVLPSFASLWLVPRLGKFTSMHAGIDVSVLTSNSLVDFSSDNIDVGVRYGMGGYDGLTCRKLMPEYVNVVCTPAALYRYIKTYGSIENMSGLSEVPFIDDVGPKVTFKQSAKDWMSERGLDPNGISYAFRFTDSHIAIENMISQNMFMLARLSLVEGRMKTGEVIAPFGPWTVEKAGYYLVSPEHMVLRPAAKVFVSWLTKECEVWEKRAETLRDWQG